MDYEEEIRKHENAINDLHKKQMKAKLDDYYVIFARLINTFNTRNGKEYYANMSGITSFETEPLNDESDVRACLFTKQEAIDFAEKSQEPEVLKAGIRKADEEVDNDIDLGLLNI